MESDSLNSTIPIGDHKSMKEFTGEALRHVVEATKKSNCLPSGVSRDLYAAHPSFVRVVNQQSERVLEVAGKILKRQQIRGNISRRDNEDKLELLTEYNDILLERINSTLDDMAGLRKVETPLLTQSQVVTVAVKVNPMSSSSSPSTAKFITAKNIMRPQINFKTPVDNSNHPFVPRLTEKPNGLKPLAILPEYDETGNISTYLHPYEFELNKFEPKDEIFVKRKPIPYKPIDKTKFTFIDSLQMFKSLVTELSKVKEIAVDLEHHSYRSFQGFTCLMQISTRDQDYVIDTLKLREDIHLINEVFTKPDILKVFHGADSDIEWLQKDFSVYVVNMFDTHQAAKRLNYSRLSLAFLLKHHCDIDVDKGFQLADWRIRPLTNELLEYARSDTHYLLYVYDLIHNELLEQANGKTHLLQSVYQCSTELCKKKYIKPPFYPDSYMELYRKSKKIFDNRQLYAYKEIFDWRNKIARQEDESCGYVLPNHMLLQIAESLPREMQGILACCNPIPPLVRQNLHIIHQLILKAREQQLVKPLVANEENLARSATVSMTRDFNHPLHCPHDVIKSTEFRDDLETLLGERETKEPIITIAKSEPRLSVFQENSKKQNGVRKVNGMKFVSPYARYLAIIPMINEQIKEDVPKEKPKIEQPITSNGELEVLAIEPVEIDTTPRQTNSQLRIIGTNPTLKFNEVSRKRPATNTDVKNQPSFKQARKNDKQKAIRPTFTAPSSSNKPSNSDWVANPNKKKTNPNNRFDYGSVNFNRFQGGANKTNSNQTNNSNQGNAGQRNKVFKANKKLNKLLSFGNNKSKRGKK